jgi:hypothetical protein
MSTIFSIDISYMQVAVFPANIESPFNNWTNAHVNQGFAWRPGAVSFRALENGPTMVEIATADALLLRASTVRAIRVPFDVPSSGELEIASITDGARWKVEPGEYAIVFETGHDSDNSPVCRFTFIRGGDQEPKVLKADGELRVPEVLLMTAEPA